jgi:peptidoglycan/LPS O-acetylase OafA/YrhL
LLRGSLLNYVIRRLSRIYPAWIAINLLIAFGFSFIWQHLSPSELFNFQTPFIYFLTCLIPPPGIFNQGAIRMNFLGGLPLGITHSGGINGSAWSLALEFLCYAVLAVLFYVSLKHKADFS